jgi:hypothetical protein
MRTKITLSVIALILLILGSAFYSARIELDQERRINSFMDKGGRFTHEEGCLLEDRVQYLYDQLGVEYHRVVSVEDCLGK